MKSVLTQIPILTILLISCTEVDTTKYSSNSEITGSIPGHTSVVECYEHIKGKDTVRLSISRSGEIFEGKLTYSLSEKDKNSGTVQGKINGEIFLGDYTFLSEGVTSVRQVAFRKVADTLMEGYGEIETIGNRAMFKDPASLDFQHSIKLSKISCW